MNNPHAWTEEEFQLVEKSLLMLYTIRGKPEPEKAVFDLYMLVLEKLPFACAMDALNQSVIKYKYHTIPTPADLIEPYAELVNLYQAEQEIVSIRAFQETAAAVYTYGPNATVSFEDPRSSEVIANYGGWPKFCAGYHASSKLLFSQFVIMYKAIRNPKPNRPLLGTDREHTNPIPIQKGFSIEKYYQDLHSTPLLGHNDSCSQAPVNVKLLAQSLAKTLSVKDKEGNPTPRRASCIQKDDL